MASAYRTVLSVLAWVLAFAPAWGVSAQAGPPPLKEEAADTDNAAIAEARALFEEGVAHSDAEEWQEAVASFQRALEKKSAPAVHFNLAAALVELGQFRKAQHHATQVRQDPETSDALREMLVPLEERIAQEAGLLTVQLVGSTEGSRILVDGEPVPDSELDHPLAVRPGDHVVSAERDGMVVAEETATAEAGRTTHVVLEPVPTPAEEARTASESERSRRNLVRDWRLWAGVGAGVALIVFIAAGTATGGATDGPIEGDFNPGVLTWR